MAKERKVLQKNKKAFHNFSVEETIQCGIELVGTEVKSVKANKFSFADSYARIRKGEVWLIGLHIAPYSHGTAFNHEPDRWRKLLLHRDEIKRLRRRVDERGYTLVPLDLHESGGIVKVELGLCRGKKVHDKRHEIKQRDLKRDADRELSGRY